MSGATPALRQATDGAPRQATDGAPRRARGTARVRGRAFWLKHLHRWHWISAAISLAGMLLFAATGVTLNHAGEIAARPRVTTATATLPPALLAALPATGADETRPLPAPLRRWIEGAFSIRAGDRPAEWSGGEIYLPLPRPGGDAWLTIDRATGQATHEVTTRGWISYLNDLHKGRHTGLAWSWFIDLFALACIVFCVTGLVLLQMLARGRPATWPLVGLGLVAPILLILLFH